MRIQTPALDEFNLVRNRFEGATPHHRLAVGRGVGNKAAAFSPGMRPRDQARRARTAAEPDCAAARARGAGTPPNISVRTQSRARDRRRACASSDMIAAIGCAPRRAAAGIQMPRDQASSGWAAAMTLFRSVLGKRAETGEARLFRCIRHGRPPPAFSCRQLKQTKMQPGPARSVGANPWVPMGSMKTPGVRNRVAGAVTSSGMK